MDGMTMRIGGCRNPARAGWCVLLLALLLAAAGCGDDATTGGGAGRSDRARPLVMASSWPLFDVARLVAGDAADVVCAVPADQDARNWRPDRAALEALAGADLVLLNGAGLEGWRGRANLPRARVVDASAGFADRFIERESEVTHSHGNGEQHSHVGSDPHVWLDPELLALQVRAVTEGLRRTVDEAQRAGVDERAGVVLDQIAALGRRLAALREAGDQRVFVATHPTWAYLARRIDLRLVEVDVTREPSAEAIAAAIRAAVDGRKLGAVLWERQPPASLAERLRSELGVAQLVVAPDVVRDAEGASLAPLSVLEAAVDAVESVVGR